MTAYKYTGTPLGPVAAVPKRDLTAEEYRALCDVHGERLMKKCYRAADEAPRKAAKPSLKKEKPDG